MNAPSLAANDDETRNSDPMFIVIFKEHWENVRHIKNERLTFTNIYGIITAGTLSLMHNVGSRSALEFSLIIFLQVFSIIGLLTSLRLKLELEESLNAIDKMLRQTDFYRFMSVDPRSSAFSPIPKFRWVFPIFYFVTTLGFSVLLFVRLIFR